jgi:hypothetical protein
MKEKNYLTKTQDLDTWRNACLVARLSLSDPLQENKIRSLLDVDEEYLRNLDICLSRFIEESFLLSDPL